MYSLYTYMYQVIYINVSATGVYTSGSPEKESFKETKVLEKKWN